MMGGGRGIIFHQRKMVTTLKIQQTYFSQLVLRGCDADIKKNWHFGFKLKLGEKDHKGLKGPSLLKDQS